VAGQLIESAGNGSKGLVDQAARLLIELRGRMSMGITVRMAARVWVARQGAPGQHTFNGLTERLKARHDLKGCHR